MEFGKSAGDGNFGRRPKTGQIAASPNLTHTKLPSSPCYTAAQKGAGLPSPAKHRLCNSLKLQSFNSLRVRT
jgi:hypothetical protein